MARIDLGLILPPTGTIIYSDAVQMNYNIPQQSALRGSGKTEILSVATDDRKETDKNGE